MVGGYLGEEKRFFGGCDEVGDVVGCSWERGDKGRDGGCSHRDLFLCVGGGLFVVVEAAVVSLVDYQVPIRQSPPIVAGS